MDVVPLPGNTLAVFDAIVKDIDFQANSDVITEKLEQRWVDASIVTDDALALLKSAFKTKKLKLDYNAVQQHSNNMYIIGFLTTTVLHPGCKGSQITVQYDATAQEATFTESWQYF